MHLLRANCKLNKKNFFRFNSDYIAIDVGPSTSIVVVIDDGNPKVIENIEGERTTPAFVAFEDDLDVVGITARRQALIHPKNTISNFHNLLGKKYEEEFLKKFNYNFKTRASKTGRISIEDVSKKVRTVEEITSILLKRMKETAENNLGRKAPLAIIGVPTYFGEEEINALTEATVLAGLKVETFVPEPIAAALAYGFGKQPGSKKLLVFDLGGRGLDVTILDVLGTNIEIKHTARDEFLGGEAFDDKLIEYVQNEFKEKEGIDLKNQPLAQQKLKNASEVAKCELSTSMSNEINIPYIAANEQGPKHLLVKITRSKLESIFEPLIEKTLEPIKAVLEEAQLKPGDIDEVLLVGGQAKTPRVAENLENFFGKPVFRSNTISPDEVIAMGLHSYTGVKTDTGEATKFTSVPLDIGVDVFGKKEILVKRETPLPVNVTKYFTTPNDNQAEVDVKIMMGALSLSSKNENLMRVLIPNLPNSLQHELQIEVNLQIDIDGNFTLTGREFLSQSEPVSATLELFGGLSQSRANNLIEEASKFNEKPDLELLEERKVLFGEFTELERIIYSCRAVLSESDRNKLNKQLVSSKTELENGTLQEPRNKLKEINLLFANSIHNAIKEEQSKLLNIE